MHELDSVQLNFNSSTITIMNICLGFIMFGIALGLSFDDFKRLFKMPKLVIVGFSAQFLILPLVTFIFIWLVKPIPSIALGLFMIAACPGGNISNFISSLSKGNVALSITLTAISTCVAPFLTPINFNFWANLYPETQPLLKAFNISFLDMLQTVITLLGIPLAIGLIVKYRFPNFTTKITKPVQRLSLVIFSSFIVFALLGNWEYFLKYIGVIFIIVFAHNALALFTGYGISHLFKFSEADKRTITIETGIQNAGLGLIIVLTFFKGLGGMAIIAAWWGVWDMLVGLALGYYWSKR